MNFLVRISVWNFQIYERKIILRVKVKFTYERDLLDELKLEDEEEEDLELDFELECCFRVSLFVEPL